MLDPVAFIRKSKNKNTTFFILTLNNNAFKTIPVVDLETKEIPDR